MAINKSTFDIVALALELAMSSPPIRMCELGDQHILAEEFDSQHALNKTNTFRFMIDRLGRKRVIAKDYFVSLGVDHVSVDLNNRYDSLKLDLSKPIDSLRDFDIVTNYGTSEHILDQYQAFRNIHNFMKTGGFQVHAVPLVGSWKDHCVYHYTGDFFRNLSEACKYEVVENKTIPIKTSFGIDHLTCSVLEKTNDLFCTEEEFYNCGIVENDTDVPMDVLTQASPIY